jgi:heptaprenyl diphosphate synthase
VLDLVGSEELLGKPAGSDLREGVLTLPVIDALGEAPQLRELLAGPLPDRDVERSRKIVLSTGAVERAVVTAREQVGEAKRLMREVSGVDTRYVEALVGLAESVLRRGLAGLPSSTTDLGELSPPLFDPAVTADTADTDVDPRG